MLHIPLLRQGQPYRSIEVARLPHYQHSGETVVEVSQANAGLIRRDLLDQESGRRALAAFSVADLLRMCARAAEHFMTDTLPVGEEAQTPDDYVRQLSATTGLPHVLVRKNMEKIRGVLAEMGSVLGGLTRSLDLKILDAGFGEANGHALSFYPRAESLGVVLPSNSPGVHSLWIPAFALKTALNLKPGSAEPWTPYRIIQALIRAGAPREAFGFYPTDHIGSGEILRHCGRGMIFGDTASTAIWKDYPGVEIHGPGYSKIVIGLDRIDEWEKHLDVLVASIADNGGRSCINASSVWVPARGAEIAEALAERLSRIVPRAADDDQALLAPFANPKAATSINASIDQALEQPGARDVTAAHRTGNRLVTWEGSSYLLPTVVLCETPGHPLANREFLFPFASVVEVNQDAMPGVMGPSLVVTAITSDQQLIRRLIASPHVDRLNIGSVPTSKVSWDQPHEGNLFEHLYGRRAFQRAAAA